MSSIKDIPTNWRDKYQRAQFRWAIFFVEQDGRGGGRRVALHQYPKRNIPYAEDMGRTANSFTVQGYLIGRITNDPADGVSYLDLKNNLIECLEQDGPGMLRLPLPYKMSDVMVMVQSYSITESREKGGICTVEMSFVEYGDPTYRPIISTTGQLQQSTSNVEQAVTGPPTPDTPQEAAPYAQIYNDAMTGNTVPNLQQ